MNDSAQNKDRRGPRWLRVMLLAVAILTSPILCCTGSLVLEALPSSWLPGPLAFATTLFEGEVRVENKTPQTLYLTPMTTAYGEPVAIPQTTFRQRDIPLKPQSSITLKYDAADFPLEGIAVCKTKDDCRLLPADSPTNVYEVHTYESLTPLDPTWQVALQSTPRYNYILLFVIAVSLIPIASFAAWLYLNRRERPAT
ncbi:MAG: hypothetical protein D6770_08195 [Anaerolineae bacterium]|nr:MAG: hypothetical protein D6770_08195 [Anaerolineae bacterium]